MSTISAALRPLFSCSASVPAQSLTTLACLRCRSCLFSSCHPAHAVIVRGTVTDPLGAVVPGARVQLIQGKAGAVCHHRRRRLLRDS